MSCLVLVEHPYAGDVERNVRYGRACMKLGIERATKLGRPIEYRRLGDEWSQP